MTPLQQLNERRIEALAEAVERMPGPFSADDVWNEAMRDVGPMNYSRAWSTLSAMRNAGLIEVARPRRGSSRMLFRAAN